MKRQYVLGVDVGSSSCKIGLFDTKGNCYKLNRIQTSVSTLSNGITIREYNPEAWWGAVALGIRSLFDKTEIKSYQIQAVGLTGQIGTHVFLDPKGHNLMPSISWQDGRASEEASWLAKKYPGDSLDELIGMHLPPGTAWPIPRLMWLKKHNPQMFDQPFIMMQPKDYIAYQLTGNMHTDILSLRGLLHPVRKKIDQRISQEILKIDDIRTRLPGFSEAHQQAGVITIKAGEQTGLRPGTVVVTGCGDFHSALIGTGVFDDSFGFNITGTSDHVGVLCPTGEVLSYDARLGKYPSVVKGWDIWYGATSAGGGSIQWFLKKFLEIQNGDNTKSLIHQMLSHSSESNGLLFLPYINGERAPIWDTQARGMFFGFGAFHQKTHFLRAVMEGVAFSLKQNIEIMQQHGKKTIPIKISGAAADSEEWNQIKADIFQVPVSVVKCKEASCLGAAIIATVGTGFFKDVKEASKEMTSIEVSYRPDYSKKLYYDEMFGVYKDLYIKVQEQYIRLSEIREMK